MTPVLRRPAMASSALDDEPRPGQPHAYQEGDRPEGPQALNRQPAEPPTLCNFGPTANSQTLHLEGLG